MFHKDESELGSKESQPPSTGCWARHALKNQINDITEEVSTPSA